SRNNLNRNGFFFHLLSEKENPTEKLTNKLFRGILYMLMNNLGYTFLIDDDVEVGYVFLSIKERMKILSYK
ncbi:hypothetical protein, partial [Lysinibacillus mangiferihumi]|uniref:hypothetical protein n=1 Tax=Lysinibacillus mangiferihumi TaxID=1130819 RepID=UPI001F1E9EE6